MSRGMQWHCGVYHDTHVTRNGVYTVAMVSESCHAFHTEGPTYSQAIVNVTGKPAAMAMSHVTCHAFQSEYRGYGE